FDRILIRDEGMRSDERTQIFRNVQGAGKSSLGQDRTELFSAVSAELIVRAQPLLQQGGERAQDAVPGEMSVRVVDALEVIDIQHHYREVAPVTQCAGDLIGEYRVELLAVREVRQSVRDRHPKDDIVILQLDIRPGEMLDDAVADSSLVAARQPPLPDGLAVVVDKRAVRRSEIDDIPRLPATFDTGVLPRDAVARQHDIVAAAAPDRNHVLIE